MEDKYAVIHDHKVYKMFVLRFVIDFYSQMVISTRFMDEKYGVRGKIWILQRLKILQNFVELV